MTKNLSRAAMGVGLLGISLAIDGAHGAELMIAGAILVAAGVIATAIIEGRRPS